MKDGKNIASGSLGPPHLSDALRAHVRELAGRIGERHAGKPAALASARDYVHARLSAFGYDVSRQTFAAAAASFDNIEAIRPGSETSSPQIVIGAHYDTVPGTPGADDNASGIAALLELARLARPRRSPLALAFVAFPNEEDPFFATEDMGSRRYAAAARRSGRDIAGMISLEMLGYYTSLPKSQRYPPLLSPFFPDRGDFIALVSDLRSRTWLLALRRALQRHLAIPIEHAALPSFLHGVSLSDHSSFWHEGWPAVMITDTSFYRTPHYHAASDSPETLDYAVMAQLVAGLSEALEELAHPSPRAAFAA